MHATPLAARRLLLPLALSLAVSPSVSAQPLDSAELVYEGSGGGDALTLSGVFRDGSSRAAASVANPIIRGENLYAADLIRNGQVWNLYYGGWARASDRNDRIYVAVSDDPLPEGNWSGQVVIIDHGEYLHVNDPSVQKRGAEDWVMAYTVARTQDGNFRDWIAISTSRDGVGWSPNRGSTSTEIEVTGAAFTDIARPSLLWTGSGWKLWFDGRIDNGPIHSYLAESSERGIPTRFSLVHAYPDAGGFPGFFEPDVEQVGGRFKAVVQRSFRDVILMESDDGVEFRQVGVLLSSTDPGFGTERLSNPGLVYDASTDRIWGTAVGMTSVESLTDHDIGFAYTQLRVQALSCPDVWHGVVQAGHLDQAVVQLFGFEEICRIRVSDPATGEVVEHEVSARAGDRFRLVWPGPRAFGTEVEAATAGPGGDVTGGCAAARSSSSQLAWSVLALMIIAGAGHRRTRTGCPGNPRVTLRR